MNQSLEEQAATTTSALLLQQLAFKSPAIDGIIARNPNAPSGLLQDFALAENPTIRQGVATNPNTPIEVLLELGAEFPAELLANPLWELMLLENPNLLDEIPDQILRSLVTQPNLPLSIRVEFGLRTSDRQLLFNLVMDPTLPAEALEKLAKRGDRSVGGVAEAAQLHVNGVGLKSSVGRSSPPDFEEELRAFACAYPADDFPLSVWVALGLVPESLFQSALGQKGREIAAACPHSTPHLLTEIAAPYLQGQQTDYYVIKKLIQNPKTPANVLSQIWQMEKQQWQGQSPVTMRLALEILGSGLGFSAELAAHPNTPVSILQELADFLTHPRTQALLVAAQGAEPLQMALAKNPHTPARVVAQLWQNPSPLVHIRLLQNLRSPQPALEAASQSPHVDIRKFVAGYSQTPASSLAALVFDPTPAVALVAVRNANLPLEVLTQILANPSAVVPKILPGAIQQYWARTPEIPAAMFENEASQDLNCLKGLARNPLTSPQMLGQLAQLFSEQAEAIRLSVAKHAKTPPEVLEALALDSSPAVRAMAIQHPQFSPGLLCQIAEVVGDRPRAAMNPLEALAKEDPARTRSALLYRSDLPAEVLALLPVEPVDYQIAQTSPERVPSLLERYYRTHSSPGLLRLLLLRYPHLSAEFLATVSSSTVWQERWAIAFHPNTPATVRQDLAQDANRIVRAAAQDAGGLVIDSATTPEKLWELALRDTANARLVARHPNADPELLQDLAQATDRLTRQGAATNPNTPTATLLQLGAEFPGELLDNPVFTLLLLENPNLVAEIPLDTLRSIVQQSQVPLSFLVESALRLNDRDLLLGLTVNPKTPLPILVQLVEQKQFSNVATAAKLHVNWSEPPTQEWHETLETLLRNLVQTFQSEHQLQALAAGGLIPERFIAYWLEKPQGSSILVAIAKSSRTPVQVLRDLATLEDEKILLALAENPSTPQPILEKLGKRSHPKIRSAIAANPQTPVTTIKHLVRLLLDRDPKHTSRQDTENWYGIQMQLAQNPNLPQSLLEQLAQDAPDTYTRGIFASSPYLSPQRLEQFATGPTYHRHAVARNPSTPPRVLEQLAQFRIFYYSLSQNPALPVYVLEQIMAIKGGAFGVTHPRTPPERLVQLLRESGDPPDILTGRQLARNPATPGYLLSYLYQASQDSETITAIAAHPETPAEILEAIAQQKNRVYMDALSKNPHLPIPLWPTLLPYDYQGSGSEFPKILGRFLQQHPDQVNTALEHYAASQSPWVRLMVLLHPDISASTLTTALDSLHWSDRYAVSQNPQVSIAQLQRLAQDANRIVRAAAMSALDSLSQPLSQPLSQQRS